MSEEQMHARDRIVQQMSRSGLVEENITQGTVKNISQRQEDFLISGDTQPEQAHDRSQQRNYYDSRTDPIDTSSNEGAELSGNTEAEEPMDEPLSAPEEFAALINRTGNTAINHNSSETSPFEDVMEKTGQYFDHKNRKLGKKIRQEKRSAGRHLQFQKEEPEEEKEEEEAEENKEKEETESETEKTDNKKTDDKKTDKNRLKESNKRQLKFKDDAEENDEKNAEETKEKKKIKEKSDKKKKRLHFEKESEEDATGDLSHEKKKKREAEKEEEEKEENGIPEKTERARLKFEDDAGYGRTRLAAGLAGGAARKGFRNIEDDQEKRLDFGAGNAYQFVRGGMRTGRYAYRKRRISRLRYQSGTEKEDSSTKPGKVGGRVQGQKTEPQNQQDGARTRLKEKTASSSKLKNGSRYLKRQEGKDEKKEYQRRINQQKSMETAQTAREQTKFTAVAKSAAAKAAAAAKGSIAVFLVIMVLLLLLFFIAVYVMMQVLMLGSSGASAIYGGLYQSTYSDITDCEAYFREREADLEDQIAHIEEEEEYADCYEYIYNLGNVGHRAVDLISYLSTKYTDFTLEMCRGELDSLFEERYTLTIEIREEPREREKRDEDGNIIYGEDGDPVMETFPAKICYITLEVKPWDEIMDGRLSEEEKSRYRVYLTSQGAQQVYGNPLLENWQNKISSPFGYRIHPITKEKKMHNGIDIAVPTGTPLYSSTDGVVTTARYSETAGNYIIVLMESGYSIKYMHLDSLGVSEGDTVHKGDLIGATGNTGNSTGPHLHLEIRTPDNKAIDPTFIVANGAGTEIG